MAEGSITIYAYSSSAESKTGHVTFRATVGDFSKVYERTIAGGMAFGQQGVSLAGIVQEAPPRIDLQGEIVEPSATYTIPLSGKAAIAVIIEMERLIKVDSYYGLGFNNCADLIDQALVVAGKDGFPWGKGLSGKVDGPITLSLPGYI